MNLLIVEDEQKVAENLKAGLEAHGYTVMVAFDGLMGLKLLKQKTFDLMLCDLILPGKNGFEVSREARLLNPEMKIILLTALDSIEDKVEGFDAGADDYMVKPFDLRELLARIKVITQRRKSDESEKVRLKIGDLELDLGTKTAYRANEKIELTAKEYSLLHYLMSNKGKVLSRMQITEQVWDLNFDPGTNVVDVYINILRKKIDKNHDQKYIQTKVGMGYMLSHEIA
jgi:two-component system, OmpR family, copper resistance phosphate regulon response regulator CusR